MDSGQFREWFRDQLTRREWSQRDFSRRSRLSPSTISEWYRGTRVPDPASVDVIADVFGLNVDDVLAIAGHRPHVDPIPPDDPRRELHSLLDRVELTPERLDWLRSTFEVMIKYDRQQRLAPR